MAGTRKLGKPTDQRLAMLKTQTTDFIKNEQIVTTESRAKELKSIVDSLIALAIKEHKNFEETEVKVVKAKLDSNGRKVTEKATSKNGKEYLKVVKEEKMEKRQKDMPSRLNARRKIMRKVNKVEGTECSSGPEKVQKDVVVNYLGTKITAKYVSPQKIQFRTDGLCTLNDFQKLLGDIQWVRPYLSLTNKQLQPLYDILPGNTDLNSPRYLTDAARKALLVEQSIQSTALKHRDESKQFILCVLQTESQPTGVLWQGYTQKSPQPRHLFIILPQ